MSLDKFVRNLNKIPSFWISRVQILDHEPVREPNGTPTNEVAILKRSLKRLVFRLDTYTSLDCEIVGDKNLKDLKVIWNVAHASNIHQYEAYSKLKNKNYKAGKYISFRTFREIVKKSCALTYPGAK